MSIPQETMSVLDEFAIKLDDAGISGIKFAKRPVTSKAMKLLVGMVTDINAMFDTLSEDKMLTDNAAKVLEDAATDVSTTVHLMRDNCVEGTMESPPEQTEFANDLREAARYGWNTMTKCEIPDKTEIMDGMVSLIRAISSFMDTKSSIHRIEINTNMRILSMLADTGKQLHALAC